MKKIIVGIFIGFFYVGLSGAATMDVPDTTGNRLAAATHYLEVVPMREMMRDTIIETAKNLPVNVRPQYIKFMSNTIRLDVLERAALASLVQRFSLKELNALSAFYGSPEGRSIMKKMGPYLGDLMPVIDQELLRAQKLQQQ